MKAVVYAESPYQLLNALEYISVLDMSSGKFLLRDNGNQIQKDQFNEVVKVVDGKKVKHITLPQSGGLKLLYLVKTNLTLLLYAVTFRNVILGDGKSIVSKTLLPILNLLGIKITLVDDGLYLLDFIGSIEERDYTIFTNLPIEKYIKDPSNCNLKVIKKKNVKAEVISGNNLNIIGMKLSEFGLMSESIYIRTLLDFVAKYPNYQVNYYPHRGESNSKLKILSDNGFIMQDNNLPMEEYFIANGAPGGVYVTFYSTALFNLSMMLDECDFYALELDVSFWPEQYRSEIAACYDLFRVAGINVKKTNLEVEGY